MNLRDRDIELAILPLAGDPAETFARVMSALPQTAPRRPTRWPLWLAAVLAALLVGWSLGRLGRSAPEPAAPADPEVRDRDVPYLSLASGPVAVELGTGTQDLGPWKTFPFDHFVTTGARGYAIAHLPSGVELRVGPDSRIAVHGPRSATLVRGALCVVSPSGPFRVEAAEGVLECANATGQLVAREAKTTIVALDGEIGFSPVADTPRRLRTGEVCAITDGIVGEPHRAPSLWEHVSWQHEPMLYGGRLDELLGFAYPLVWQLGEPALAAQAESDLRRAGSLGALAIGSMLQGELRPEHGAAWRRAVSVLADITDAMTCRMLEPVIRADDAEMRVIAVGAIERVTGVASGRDLEFWRTAPAAVRFDALLSWRDRLRGF